MRSTGSASTRPRPISESAVRATSASARARSSARSSSRSETSDSTVGPAGETTFRKLGDFVCSPDGTRVAQFEDDRAQASVKRSVALLPGCLVLIVGLVVGAMVLRAFGAHFREIDRVLGR